MNDGAVHQQLSLPMITLLILPNDKEELIKVCLKANNVFVEKSRNSNTAKVERSCSNLIKVFELIYLLLLFYLILCILLF
jgi:hypothetical protein